MKGRKPMTTRNTFQAHKVTLIVPREDNGEHVRKKLRKGRSGNYRIAFMITFEGLTDAQLELQEEYVKNLLADYKAMDRKFFKLEPIAVTPTVLGGNYTYKVTQGGKRIGTVSVAVSITRLTGKSLCVIFNERNNTQRKSNTIKQKE